MANTVSKQELGAFAAGAIPPPFEHEFTDFNELPVDISTFPVRRMNIECVPSVTGPLGQGTIGFTTDGTNGKVTYNWSATDFAEPGSYSAQMWVSNDANTPTQRYESDLLLITVYDGPGEAP